jgi:hypothetical protein
MRQLNYRVDGEKRQAKDVVREFLIQKGFMSEKDLAKGVACHFDVSRILETSKC